MFAHSLPSRPLSEWEPLHDHLLAVANRAAEFAEVFGWAELGRAGGWLHDIGKCSTEFQSHISVSAGDHGGRGPDHSSAGAREALRLFGKGFGTLLAFVIAGHHAGLADGDALEARLSKEPPAYDGWEAHAGALPAAGALAPTRRPLPGSERGFGLAFLARMVFSCLVDADRLETAAFYERAEGRTVERGGGTPLSALRDRLRAHMAVKREEARARASSETERRLNALRADILDHALALAPAAPGLFTMTVPTGGGKTLASLSFALDHAVRHRLRRVVYVIPFAGARIETGIWHGAGHGGRADRRRSLAGARIETWDQACSGQFPWSLPRGSADRNQ